MPYAERAYFDGDHCAHCAARDEFNRLLRLERNALRFIMEQKRRTLCERRFGSRRAA